ncbi:MAG: methylenetetrahydrofolate--tRNA-(uracil(54)-C(5))-methyltransferase (FADH(2)-oxidizing) TrmFO [Bdellovibrionales bacterium]|nr:methylenetetrahydrofolate--tRNA-(uracil(54)-C(5))-methyltransferase (FADH(2)-oxidizing) TrmFO [Bdellovibrionales bacterium]
MTLKISDFLKSSPCDVVVVGAGLAGSECAWQLAELGHKVALIEQRPERQTEAHTGPLFAELVCSNSLKSTDPESAPGLFKDELRRLNSLVLRAADESMLPAGQSLAVDREKFSQSITAALEAHPNVEILRAHVQHYEELIVAGPQGVRPIVLATGPLTSEPLANSLKPLVGDQLYFYDAIAPIVNGSTVDMNVAFTQNRYNKGADGVVGSADEGDYLNCPFTQAQYEAFIAALGSAEKVQPHDFEKAVYFQGCQPIEALLERGPMTLAFGPMKPVGLADPRTGAQPYAVVQLRKEDSEGRAWNMVGFQTKLKYPEQKKVFALIPGLQNAEFYRFGSLHRNTYICSPSVLDSNFRLKNLPALHFAGQITGVEGYLESCGIGALVARLLSLRLRGLPEAPLPPVTTAIGALAHATVNGKVKNFQPMNINWGLVPLNEINERDKAKKTKMVARAKRHFEHWLALFG